MSDTYTTKQVSALTGASPQAIRQYTGRYARYLSTEATPEGGQDRRFTVEDAKLIAYIYTHTRAGATHDSVMDQLADGALDSFDWQPQPAIDDTAPPSATDSQLVPLERLHAAHALLQEAQRREQLADEKAAALQAEVNRLAHELGKAQGESAALKEARYRAPAWWRLLFGGRD